MIFFGTSRFSVIILDQLLLRGIKPDAVVTVPDRPQGRKLILTPPLTKVWAEAHGVPCMQFEKLDESAVRELSMLDPKTLDVFVVASYGKIIPQSVLDIPFCGCLNIHPSLLPKYRGASPLQSSILDDQRETGVTIIKMDAKMDHGPIVAKEKIEIDPWPIPESELERQLAIKGADMLADILPSYLAGDISSEEQDHSVATFTKKITKEDGLITLNELDGEAGYKTFLKYNAFEQWPGTYFFVKDPRTHSAGETNTAEEAREMRVKINLARFDSVKEQMEILRVTPEGKKEMSWKEFREFVG